MTSLATEEVRRIVLDAARDVGYTDADDADVSVDRDVTDELAYTIVLKHDDRREQDPSLDRYARLKTMVRDTLIARGDETYPYVRFLGIESWERRKRA